MSQGKIKNENQHGAQYIQSIERVGKNVLIEVKCKFCNKHYTMWRSHYYRGSNPCQCLNKVLNKRLYSIWVNIKTRCTNQNNNCYKMYHQDEHMINMCPEWEQSYKAFENWAFEHGYNDSLTIDRINNEKDYCPENCRFVDIYEQANNKRNNVMFVYNGFRTSLKRLCQYFNLKYKRVDAYYKEYNSDYEWLRNYLNNATKVDIQPFIYEQDHILPLLPLKIVS